MSFANIKSPCLNCADRAVGCHGKCERFSEYRGYLSGLKQKREAVLRDNNFTERERKKAISKRIF